MNRQSHKVTPIICYANDKTMGSAKKRERGENNESTRDGFGSSFEDVMNGGEQIGLRKNRQQQSTNAAAGAVFLQLYNILCSWSLLTVYDFKADTLA